MTETSRDYEHRWRILKAWLTKAKGDLESSPGDYGFGVQRGIQVALDDVEHLEGYSGPILEHWEE
jgi:hypothetical protein